jgi:ABC-type sugar transport system permease subunit
LGFNVGIELGQLLVIAIALASVGWCRRRRWYRARITVPLSVAIAAVGLFWSVERVLVG